MRPSRLPEIASTRARLGVGDRVGRRLALVAVVMALAGLPLVLPTAAPAAALPAGFSNVLVTDGVERPTALAFTPAGRMLITSQLGKLFVIPAGQTDPVEALDITARVCFGNTERGLLGVAVDPDFGQDDQGVIYLYYTFNKHGNDCPTSGSETPVNRVARFEFDGNTVSPGSEQVLIDNIPSPIGRHNGGDVQFGKDGNLYVSVGDGVVRQNARRLNILSGKILRITPDGGIPPGNPFTGEGTARCHLTGRTSQGTKCREVFARGLRNPFRIAFDPDAGGTRFFINDVGQQTWEEINQGQAAADYGWHVCEGPNQFDSEEPCRNGLTKPFFAYQHLNGCSVITGGAFVPNNSNWPATHKEAYLFADLGCERIFTLTKEGRRWKRGVFDAGAGRVVHLAFGPHQTGTALYYTTIDGQVRVIARDAA